MFGGEGARKSELQDMTLRRVAASECETAKHVQYIFRFENRMQELKEKMSREDLKLCWNVHTVTNRYPCIMQDNTIGPSLQRRVRRLPSILYSNNTIPKLFSLWDIEFSRVAVLKNQQLYY